MKQGHAAIPYEEFLRAKVAVAPLSGFEIELNALHPILKPHQRVAVQWALRGGRRALFEAFGLGKSVQQLELMRLVQEHTKGRTLIVAPLGVRQEFRRDAIEMLGWEDGPKFIRSIEEADRAGIYITNYEPVRDGKLDPAAFEGTTLDEAAVLRGFGGTKTFREFMRLFESVHYRFVATATPAPNEYIEILAYAAYLGIMDVGQAKTRFFKRNSEKADELTLHPHKEREFWMWVASWALFLQRPSDLGFSDEGYELPPMFVEYHEVPVDHTTALADKAGQGAMFREATKGVVEAAREKRDTLKQRLERVAEIVRSIKRTAAAAVAEQDSGIQGVSAQLPAGVLPSQESSRESGHSGTSGISEGIQRTESGDAAGEAEGAQQSPLSCEQISSSTENAPQSTQEIWPHPAHLSGHAGQPAGVLRDLLEELPHRSDARGPLPQDGQGEGHSLPGVQHCPRLIRRKPGSHDGSSGLSDQIIIWCDLNDEQRGLEKLLDTEDISYSSLDGSQSVEEREALIDKWRNRETSVFLSKPVMYGAGVNLQQCHTMIFSGVGFKFSDFFQATKRIHRFLQTEQVTIQIIYAESERHVLARLREKWTAHEAMVRRMSEIIREYGLAEASLASAMQRSIGVERTEVVSDSYRLVNNDCVLETRRMDENSVGLVLTSIPFSTQYEYTPSYNDFGHSESNEQFFEQLDYLTPELLRVVQPGRLAVIHVKDRIVPGGMTGLGFQTVYPFHARCIEHYTRHGFAYMGMKTIVTDVVRENNQTYRLGWTEQCKDGSKMGCGMPEYLLLFRKPPSDATRSYADLPVEKSKADYSRSRWQIDAHGYARSSGNRLMSRDELRAMDHASIFQWFRKHSLENVYDFEEHVAAAEMLEACGECGHIHIGKGHCATRVVSDRCLIKSHPCECTANASILPVTFMLLQPQSWHEDVWADVTRMRTLNGAQYSKGKEMHLCPMQFDIADRIIAQFSMEGETIYDPFGGLMTVPMRAVMQKRFGIGCELNPGYFRDGVSYVEAAARKRDTPSLFDALEEEEAIA